MGQEINNVIYNDGIPSLSFQGSHSDFLRSIQDEVLDEAFPPTAEEAAELEAVEIFVEMMATLSYLEDREEATRSVHAGLKKRWEARRELVGRPKPAKYLIKPVIHMQPTVAGTTELVSHDHSNILEEHRMRQRGQQVRMTKLAYSKKYNKGTGHQKPIQQPRKQN
jgi:hypothetical protein